MFIVIALLIFFSTFFQLILTLIQNKSSDAKKPCYNSNRDGKLTLICNICCVILYAQIDYLFIFRFHDFFFHDLIFVVFDFIL